MNRDLLLDCLKHAQSALKAVSLYPPGHPGVQGPIASFVRDITQLLERGHPIVLGVVDDVLVVDEIPFYETETTWRPLFKALNNRGLESITFNGGFDVPEMLGIVRILSERGEGTDSLAREWKEYGIEHATYREQVEGDGIRAKAHATYVESLGIVLELFTELRMGKIPSSAVAMRVVDGMRDIVLQDPNALLGMAMMKAYDDYTFNHSLNTSIFCQSLGHHLGLPQEQARNLGLAGLLHDMGKVRTDNQIVRKPGALDDDELRLMQLHPELGVEILQSMQGIASETVDLVLAHHLRHDRKGYPKIAPGTEIHPLSEAIGLADCYDALTTTRPYQRSRHPSEAIRIIRRNSGSAYSPEIVESFVAMLGAYPIGEALRLATGEVAVVVGNNNLDVTAPTVRLVRDEDGNALSPTERIDLADPAEAKREIIQPVDPLSTGIDIAAILEEESGAPD